MKTTRNEEPRAGMREHAQGRAAPVAGEGKMRTRGRLAETLRLIREREGIGQLANGQSAARAALAALRHELDDVIAEIPLDLDLFDFSLSHGEPPRLWIDATTFVVMTPENVSYRLFKHTRAGRVLLRESRHQSEIAHAVVHYVAERLSPYENRFLQSETPAERSSPQASAPAPLPSAIVYRTSFWQRFCWFLLGSVSGALGLFVLVWFRDDLSALLARLQALAI